MASRVRRLAEELEREPVARANNLPLLLAAIAGADEAAARAAIQGAKLFFVDACDSGALRPGDGRDEAAAAAAAAADGAAGGADAAAVYGAWLRRHYGDYTAQLLGLLASSAAAASVQARALP